MGGCCPRIPPWQTVYDHFNRWNKSGVWETALDEVNARRRKKSTGRPVRATPSSTRKASKPSTPARNAGSTEASE